ncbi:MAG TPA: DNA methyltransferase [Chlamydiales bacterium]|nr:DNA methyltransferase [Chlamydiales bacterium]
MTPDTRNARTHSKRQVSQIVSSIQQFGYTNPLLIDENGVIIAGHGRLLAAKSLGMTEIATIELRHLNDVQKRTLRLADNKIALNAGWDTDQLKIELGQLAALNVDFDLTITGFSTGELDILLEGHVDPQDDLIPEPSVDPRAQAGDVWACGEHRIGCGDGRSPDFLKQVVGEGISIDVAFLDPPYNVRINGHANAKGRHREFKMASGEMNEKEFIAFLEESLATASQVSRDGAVHFVCMDWRHVEELSKVGRQIYDSLLNICVWNKSNAGMGSLYRSKYELVFVFRVGSAQHFNAVELGRHGRNRSNVWEYASVNSLGGSRHEDLSFHPTVKPISLVADAIQDVTKRGDIVLDSFLGSGTTLLAAERSGRIFRGTEIDPIYVDIAMARWESMTGKRATLIHRRSP